MRARVWAWLIGCVAGAVILTAATFVLVCGYERLPEPLRLIPACIGVLVAVGLIGVFAVSRIIRPLDPDRPSKWGETRGVYDRIESQRRELRDKHKALADRERKLAAITENMTEGLALLDGGGVILLMNAAASRLLGAERDMTGKHIVAVCRDNLLQAAVHGALGGTPGGETFYCGGRTLHAVANPVRPEGGVGGVGGVVLMLFDVTEQALAEQLRREFSANVSHELKTPLTSISGYAELIQTGLARQADVPELAGRIVTESARLVALIDDIMRLSRLDEDAHGEETEPVELLALCKECADRASAAASAAGVSIDTRGDAREVRGQRRLLEELAFNLIDNAVKYNRPGGHVTVTVGARGRRPFLSVRDDGIGIAPEHMDRIFERFYRVDKSRSKDTGGTGLGLSIVKHAAVWHRAEIEAESTPGKGTCITVLFPESEGGY